MPVSTAADAATFLGAALPGFDDSRSGVAIPVDPNELRRLCEKVARGLTYVLEEGLVIGPDYVFSYFVDPDKAASIEKLLTRFGRREERGPGILVAHAAPAEDRRASVFSFKLWGAFEAWGAVQPKEATR